MNRVNTKASRLIELYCEIEIRDNEDEPKITKLYPKDYPDGEMLIHFAYPHKNKVEK